MTFLAAFAALLARTAIIGGLVYLWSQRSALARRWRIYRQSLPEGQLRWEIKATLLVLAFDALVVTGVRELGIVRYQPSHDVVGVLLTFLLVFVWMELWFYWTHRLLHLPAFYRIHRQHHRSRVTDPLSALSFSLLDRAITLAGPLAFVVVLSQFYPISLGGVLLIGISNYVLNVIGHTNVEFMPEAIARSSAGRLLVTPSYHLMHHARIHGNYGLFTTVCDRLFGTAHNDHAWVYLQARAGEPLDNFNTRAPVGSST